MNKKNISKVILILTLFLLNLSVYADTLPNFPMSVWWSIKNWTTPITSWVVQVYKDGVKLWEVDISSNWQYWWNSAFDQIITLNEFTWSINFKAVVWGASYDVNSSNITKMTTSCPNPLSITFVSEVCQYDLSVTLCNPSSVANWSINWSTCAITCDSWYRLSWTSCINSNSWWWGGWWAWVTTSSCLDSQLMCSFQWDRYILLRKTWVSCQWWNLWKSCIINTDTWWFEVSDNIITWSVTENSLWEIVITRSDGTVIVLKDIRDSFARDYIIKLILLWIANWYPDKTFRPDQAITRAEFLKIILRSMEIDYSSVSTSSLPFSDVNKSSWEAKVIARALELNIIDWNNKKFNPTRFISRAEAMKILIRTSWLSYNVNSVSTFLDTTWWPVKYIESAKEYWIVDWYIINWNPYFQPFANMTRAEVAKIVIKTMDLK